MLPGVGLTELVAPGIVLYAVAYTAFQNSAAMIVMDKMEGVIADVQMAPVSPLEIVVGFVLSRSEEHTSELQSLMRISYAVFCLTKKTKENIIRQTISRLTTQHVYISQ